MSNDSTAVKRDIVMETCERESSDSLNSDSILRLQDNGQYQGTQDRTHTSQSTIPTYSTIQHTVSYQPLMYSSQTSKYIPAIDDQSKVLNEW